MFGIFNRLKSSGAKSASKQPAKGGALKLAHLKQPFNLEKGGLEGVKSVLSEKTLSRLTETDLYATRYPPFKDGLDTQIETHEMVSFYYDTIIKIASGVGMSGVEFDRIVFPAICKFIEFAYNLPASQNHHHKGAGGLTSHSLEVALFALARCQVVVFDHGLSPQQRTFRRERWYVAAVFAALLHDAGKPLSDYKVRNGAGDKIWPAASRTIPEWARENDISRYFLDWNSGRGITHKGLSATLINRFISDEARDWIMQGGSDIYSAMVSAINGDDQTNPLTGIVLRADSASVEKDLKDHGGDATGLGGSLAVPIVRSVIDCMRRFIDEGKWKANEAGERLWVTPAGIFLVWAGSAGARDVVDEMLSQGLKGFPQGADSLGEFLADRDIIEITGDGSIYWQVAPDILSQVKGKPIRLKCIKFKSETTLYPYQSPPDQTACSIGPEGSEVRFEVQGQQQDVTASLSFGSSAVPDQSIAAAPMFAFDQPAMPNKAAVSDGGFDLPVLSPGINLPQAAKDLGISFDQPAPNPGGEESAPKQANEGFKTPALQVKPKNKPSSAEQKPKAAPEAQRPPSEPNNTPQAPALDTAMFGFGFDEPEQSFDAPLVDDIPMPDFFSSAAEDDPFGANISASDIAAPSKAQSDVEPLFDMPVIGHLAADSPTSTPPMFDMDQGSNTASDLGDWMETPIEEEPFQEAPATSDFDLPEIHLPVATQQPSKKAQQPKAVLPAITFSAPEGAVQLDPCMKLGPVGSKAESQLSVASILAPGIELPVAAKKKRKRKRSRPKAGLGPNQLITELLEDDSIEHLEDVSTEDIEDVSTEDSLGLDGAIEPEKFAGELAPTHRSLSEEYEAYLNCFPEASAILRRLAAGKDYCRVIDSRFFIPVGPGSLTEEDRKVIEAANWLWWDFTKPHKTLHTFFGKRGVIFSTYVSQIIWCLKGEAPATGSGSDPKREQTLAAAADKLEKIGNQKTLEHGVTVVEINQRTMAQTAKEFGISEVELRGALFKFKEAVTERKNVVFLANKIEEIE